MDQTKSGYGVIGFRATLYRNVCTLCAKMLEKRQPTLAALGVFIKFLYPLA
ncbi:hypothetical protein ICC18_22185 [Paenibacillus sp. WST5]|uniref:Uncharacterized protein n=1 Tax=Paenibacillus sedimenti TaxID=2770274 RepID=A0A926KRN1_9BACL|nr:hypothetical protein [Paenibacillus sedimenti]